MATIAGSKRIVRYRRESATIKMMRPCSTAATKSFFIARGRCEPGSGTSGPRLQFPPPAKGQHTTIQGLSQVARLQACIAALRLPGRASR